RPRQASPSQSCQVSAAPHPAFGHLLPVNGEKGKRRGCGSSSSPRSRGEGPGRGVRGGAVFSRRVAPPIYCPMQPRDLLHPRPEGLYCPPGDFFIDPVRPVARALITHGHSDHARPGHAHALDTRQTRDIMALRYGEAFAGERQAAAYGEAVSVNGVRVSFHPAGHVLGSAQIAVEHGGVRIVASGDYKRAADPTCAPFEPVACDVFITEATFGLPVFTHPDARDETQKLLRSMAQFPGRAHLVGAYALGKAQRMIRLARDAGYDAPVHIHGALARLCAYYRAEGVDLGRLEPATQEAG